MTIKHCRIALVVLLAWCWFLPGYVLPYVLVWFTLLEILNSRPEYTSQKIYKKLNILFVAYTFVLLNRFMHLPVSHMGREIINRGEHILFSFVVCIGIMQFLRLKFFNVRNLTRALIITSIVFETIGFLNEVYQASWDAGYIRVYFSDDAIHDMLSNAAGNILFLLFFGLMKRRRTAIGY